MRLEYIERIMIDRYSCIDTKRTVDIDKYFWNDNGSLLYFYVDQFNVKSIERDLIIAMDGKPGTYAINHRMV